ncbi:DegT/DnrJ/EryC1/StrS family aminotransferase [Caulobacter segnis]
MSMPFIDLAAQRRRIRDKIDAAIAKVLNSGAYVAWVRRFGSSRPSWRGIWPGQAGPVLQLMALDAIALPLMAWGVGRGDAVFCPSFTFAATPEVVPWVDATPVFVDVLPDTFNLDPAELDAAIGGGEGRGPLTPKVVIAVDLFGQPADDYPTYQGHLRLARASRLIADSAQVFGCTLNGQHPLRCRPMSPPPASFRLSRWAATATAGRCVTNDQTLWDLMDELPGPRQGGGSGSRRQDVRSLRPQVPEHPHRHELAASTRSRRRS